MTQKGDDLISLGVGIAKQFYFQKVKSFPIDNVLWPAIKKHLTKEEIAFLENQEEQPGDETVPGDEAKVTELETRITDLESQLAAKNAEIEELKAQAGETEKATEELTKENEAFQQVEKDKQWEFAKGKLPKGQLPADEEAEKKMRVEFEKNPSDIYQKALTFMAEHPNGEEDGDQHGSGGTKDEKDGNRIGTWSNDTKKYE